MKLGLQTLIDDRLGAFASESREFNAASSVSGETGPTTVAELRQARARLAPAPRAPGPPPIAEVADAAGREVPIRVLTPQHDPPRAVHLDIHGGGFFMGAAARGDARNRHLADALRIAVVSVDYRLAPEHPWPAAPDDCETAALWLLDHAESRFGTPLLTIGGASAGATLAVTTLLRLRDLATRFSGAVLRFGSYDLSEQTPAGRRLAGQFFIEAYVGQVSDRTNPDISPVYGDLQDLPPTLLQVGSLDFLLEDNLAMAARLSASGNDVDVRVYPESNHGFTSAPTAMAAAAANDVEQWLAERFADGGR